MNLKEQWGVSKDIRFVIVVKKRPLNNTTCSIGLDFIYTRSGKLKIKNLISNLISVNTS